MAGPKRHHYVPVMHLRHFVGSDPFGHVWTYDKRGGSARSSIPANTALEGNYYRLEYDDSENSQFVENMLSEIEGAAAPVHEVLANDQPRPLTADDRSKFALFLAAMMLRTLGARRVSADILASYLAKTYEKIANGPEGEKITAKMRAEGHHLSEEILDKLRDPKNITVSIRREATMLSLTAIEDVTQKLLEMRWCLGFVLQGYLITSDHPVVAIHDGVGAPADGAGGLIHPMVKVTFPLSRNRVLLLTRLDDIPTVFGLDRQLVDRTNQLRAGAAERYVFAHLNDKRIKRLIKRYAHTRNGPKREQVSGPMFGSVEVPRRWKDSRAKK